MAQLSAFARAADGTVSGVVIENGGRDYHGQTPTVIGTADNEDANVFRAWLAAMITSSGKVGGAFIMTSNGQAIANGSNSITINGLTANAPAAQGDAGGNLNAGIIVLYAPMGTTPPAVTSTGTFNSMTGDVAVSSVIGNSVNSMASLYLTALSYVNGGSANIAKATAQMAASGVNAPASSLLLI